ncbi:SprT family zinc-dependent metalloprotease [Aestuariivirga sp.]|uniref:M48 family metallopeptidase n=1 Tax=Aestuariivirga sp. TaxID=2650926 RepID=UPI0025BD2DF8|nr:SprT family zinc-dependent metalloprotease [Aestuariivirga sp.]MCA3554139.1 M48 family metallopeptidase [Aestuariivirga sp.]
MTGLLKSLKRTAGPEPLEPSRLLAGGQVLDVTFRRHARARRLVLRLNAAGNGVLVTVPRGVSRARALEFAERSRNWIEDRLRGCGGLIHLADGAALPLRGIEHDVRHVPGRRGVVTADRDRRFIDVPGDRAHLKRRLLDFLKAEALADLTKASAKYAGLMGVKFRRIAIRDQRSRWGSCSAAGDLSYSWRLILAPAYVLDYVAAHEVAHLRHLDHSPRFWRLVLTHCPDAARARNWLRLHGQEVHRVVV